MEGNTYIGDGVYVRFDGLQVWLTTENGSRVTNEIALPPDTLLCFELWLRQLREPQGRVHPFGNDR